MTRGYRALLGFTITVYAVVMIKAAGLAMPPGADFRKQLTAPVHGLFAGYDVWHPAAGYLTRFHVDEPAALHPPMTWLFGLPFAMVPERVGYWCWVAVTLGCLWAAVFLAARPYLRSERTLVLASLVVAGGASDFLFALGQLTGLVALGVALVIRYPRRWPGAVGVCLVALAPQTAVPVIVVLIAGRCWRTVVRGLAAVAVLSLPFAVIETVNARNVFASVLWSLRTTGRDGQGVDVLRAQWGHGGVEWLLLAAALAAVAVAVRNSGDMQAGFAASLGLAMELCYHQGYSLVVLAVALLPIALRSSSRWWVAAVAAVAVACPPVLLSYQEWQLWIISATLAAAVAGGAWSLRAMGWRYRTSNMSALSDVIVPKTQPKPIRAGVMADVICPMSDPHEAPSVLSYME